MRPLLIRESSKNPGRKNEQLPLPDNRMCRVKKSAEISLCLLKAPVTVAMATGFEHLYKIKLLGHFLACPAAN